MKNFFKIWCYVHIMLLNFTFFFSRKRQLKAIKNDVFLENDCFFKKIANFSLLKEIVNFYRKEIKDNKSLLKLIFSDYLLGFIAMCISSLLSFLVTISLLLNNNLGFHSIIYVSVLFFIIVFFCFYFVLAYSLMEDLYTNAEKNRELKTSLYAYVKNILSNEEKKNIMNNAKIENKVNLRNKRL